MLSILRSIIADFACVPKRLEKIVSQYIMFLMLDHNKHELRTAARLLGNHESNYSRIRCERSVNGLGVREYFQRHRHIPWKTIRLKVGNGRGKKRERKFRVRTAGKSHLKGFGEVIVV